MESGNGERVEEGDKIIMPGSCLNTLARLQVTYPMLFELTNITARGRKTHCGVLEFVAPEGNIFLPYWMMQNLYLEPGDIVRIRSVTMKKGTHVTFRPQSTDFLKLQNPKVILEKKLRCFSALTKGDTIMLQHADKQYCIDVIQVKPDDAISIIETDLNTEFVEPIDYNEKVEKKKLHEQKSEIFTKKHINNFQPPKSVAYSLNGNVLKNDKTYDISNNLSISNKDTMELNVDSSDEESYENIPKKKFNVFGGTGWR